MPFEQTFFWVFRYQILRKGESYRGVGRMPTYPHVLEIARTLLSSIDLLGALEMRTLNESLLLEASRDRNQHRTW